MAAAMRMRGLMVVLALGATLAACKPPGDTAATSTTATPAAGDRRLAAMEGADSAALPNVDAAAAVNQVQIPDYGPVDAVQTHTQAPTSATATPPPAPR